MKKIIERQKATDLRRQGFTYGEIKKKIGVSKQALTKWLKDIPFMPQKKTMRGKSEGFLKQGSRLHNKRIKCTKEIMKDAKKEIFKLSKRELKIVGTMLYWAEGTKADEEVSISNSDPAIIKFAMKQFREVCNVPDKKIKIQMHIHTDVDHEKCLRHWMELARVPSGQFTKTYVKKSSLGHRKNPLYNGTVKIRICDRNLHRRIMGWIEGIASFS